MGGGIRSLNVALRQILDLYACVRPVKYYQGVPSPVKHPERMDIVIFRENTEDVYAGIEWEQGTPEAARLIEFLNNDMLKGGKKQVRLDSGVGIKPISVTGTKRLVRMAIQYALENGRKSGHPRAQGQHPEIHRRRVPQVGIRAGHRRNSATESSPSARAGSSTTKTRIPTSRSSRTRTWLSPAWSSPPRTSGSRSTKK